MNNKIGLANEDIQGLINTLNQSFLHFQTIQSLAENHNYSSLLDFYFDTKHGLKPETIDAKLYELTILKNSAMESLRKS